jgi:hypothetical protein
MTPDLAAQRILHAQGLQVRVQREVAARGYASFSNSGITCLPISSMLCIAFSCGIW